MADGDGVLFKVEGVPAEAQQFAAAQAVKGGHLDEQTQLMVTAGLKELFQLGGVVVIPQVLFRPRALHPVCRIEGDQIHLHGVFERLVEIGVLPDN